MNQTVQELHGFLISLGGKKTDMKNMMKSYLGDDYSSNHLRNFCLYWLKGMALRPEWEDTVEGRAAFDEWRRKNDLDCLYFDGDLCADTLMSAWTIIKWVAEYLNMEYGIKFSKCEKDLKLLAEDRDAYLPAKDDLVKLLDRFLELAERRCNYILLSDRCMNNDRYEFRRSAKYIKFFDQVPATLWHVFCKETLGQYFLGDNGEVDERKVEEWIRREKLQMGFANRVISQENVIPLTSTARLYFGKRLKTRSDLEEALRYMICFLEQREKEIGGDLDE